MPPAEVIEPLLVSMSAHALAFVLGALFGSFGNVCIYRWPPSDEHPDGQSVVAPGSHCFSCGQPVRWYDNIPILSFFVLRGQCRHCGVEFSPRYMLVEVLLGLLFWFAYHHTVVLAHPGEPVELRLLRFAILAAFLFVVVVIAFIDLDHQLILDKVTYPAIPIFFALGLLLPERTWSDGLIGAAVGYGLIRLVADGYYLLTRRYGLGYGDGKFLAIVGALGTWKAVVAALFLGSLLGSIIGVSAVLVARWQEDHETGSDAGTGSEADSEADPEAEAEPEADPEAEADADPGSEAEAEADPGSDADPETDPDSETDADSDADPEADADPETDPDSETDADSDAEVVPLRLTAVPFGPFLAMGAIAYMFAEPWLDVALLQALWVITP